MITVLTPEFVGKLYQEIKLMCIPCEPDIIRLEENTRMPLSVQRQYAQEIADTYIQRAEDALARLEDHVRNPHVPGPLPVHLL